MTLLYALHLFGKMRALTGVVLGSIGLFALQMRCTTVFHLPRHAFDLFPCDGIPKRGLSDPSLIAAAASYFVVLNGFEAWY
jgi:hypothetical protein